MSQLFLSALPSPTQPAPVVKRFGLSAAELRAKRAAAKAHRAEQERIVEVETLAQRVEGYLTSGHVQWDSESSIAREIFYNEQELLRESHLRLARLYYHLDLKVDAIANHHRPLIEQARHEYECAMQGAAFALCDLVHSAWLDIAGSAARRRAKRDAKESRRQQRRSAQAT